ncbi:hypothetical protein SNOG_01921 [Parastagonospora nodorum SN15]|uniref:Uncharacterized protein n=1 Tax=Phaeosphaeria nodorum (strain SN15 / ATCC MYA-4574 / FGSC 10173) TaxID=321614 RepID=Q0V243_PHANO|nr:hypothetical protein SNOG_01921 [Parastagonospora nodorum SN15]EAT90133.1 hypothetical protein SNOG_01921 [Parastagonospora nodorum SN15]
MQSLCPVLQQAVLYTFLGWSFLLSQILDAKSIHTEN